MFPVSFYFFGLFPAPPLHVRHVGLVLLFLGVGLCIPLPKPLHLHLQLANGSWRRLGALRVPPAKKANPPHIR